jgi:hypothetical protein
MHSLCTATPTISQPDFQKIQLYEQYAAAAYCGTNNNNINLNPNLTCDAGNCPDVGTATVLPGAKFTG